MEQQTKIDKLEV